MRNLMLGVLLIPALLSAEPVQVEKKLICDSTEIVLNVITKEYKERPIWIGTVTDSQVAVLVNPQTTSWTIIQFNRKVACVLESGEGFKLLADFLDKKIKVND